jgi:hypothetical protein
MEILKQCKYQFFRNYPRYGEIAKYPALPPGFVFETEAKSKVSIWKEDDAASGKS